MEKGGGREGGEGATELEVKECVYIYSQINTFHENM